MPRFKRNLRVNRISNIQLLIDSWDNKNSLENNSNVKFHRSQYGNISMNGILGNYQAHALSKNHKQFVDCIEEGIKELVLLLINKFNWITYASCEGHRYIEKNINPVERYVGLLPLKNETRLYMQNTLKRVSDLTNKMNVFSPVKIEVLKINLECDDKIYDCIDVFFRRKRFYTWNSYFRNLNKVYDKFIFELNRL